jgi:hypothetical protein
MNLRKIVSNTAAFFLRESEIKLHRRLKARQVMVPVSLIESLESRTLMSVDSITTAPVTISATEGQAFNSTVVANFTDSAPATTSTFNATIHWGDGNSSAGVIQAGPNSDFNVVGGHTYLHAGSFSVTVNINSTGGGSATDTSTAAVSNAALTATAKTLSIQEGTPFSTSTVATFADANASASANDFTATVHWGNGDDTAGTVVADPNGGFDVTATHAGFARASNRVIDVTVNGAGNGAVTANSSLEVTDARLTAQGVPTRTKHRKRKTLSIVAATFTDANPLAVANNFTAQIQVGKSKVLVDAEVVAAGNGQFNVIWASHSGPGLYKLKIIIHDADGSTTTVNSRAVIT